MIQDVIDFFKGIFNYFISLTKAEIVFLLIVAGFIIGLVIFYLYARLKFPQGRSSIIFIFTLFIIDMIFDVIFLIEYVSKVRKLFFPSIIVLFGTSGLNLLIAFIFILSQAKTDWEFREWMRPRHHVATTFALLSIFHIEILGIITSNFLHSDAFNAPIKENAKKCLSIIGLIMVLLEDVSQFVILIMYFTTIGTNFTLILIMTLFVSFLSLVAGIIHRIFGLMII